MARGRGRVVDPNQLSFVLPPPDSWSSVSSAAPIIPLDAFSPLYRRARWLTKNFTAFDPWRIIHQPEVYLILRTMIRESAATICAATRIPANYIDILEKQNRLPRSKSAMADLTTLLDYTVRRLHQARTVTWLKEGRAPTSEEVGDNFLRVDDRLAGSAEATEKRTKPEKLQIAAITPILDAMGLQPTTGPIRAGTYMLNMGLCSSTGTRRRVDLAVWMPRTKHPIIIEVKAVRDAVNGGKRIDEQIERNRDYRDALGAKVRVIMVIDGPFTDSQKAHIQASGMDLLLQQDVPAMLPSLLAQQHVTIPLPVRTKKAVP